MLKQRILTALVLLPLMVGMLFFAGHAVWAMFAGLIALLALWEFARMAKMQPWHNALYILVSLVLGGYVYQSGLQMTLWQHALVLVFWLLLVPIWLSRKWPIPTHLGAWLLGWMLMLPFWLALIGLRPSQSDAGYVLAIMGLVWLADVAAYFVGRAVGKRKLAPTISPNKSWEGAIGGVVCVVIYVVVLQQNQWFAISLSLWQIVVLAVVLTAVSVCGDLLESWFKRSAGIKDSSQLLPGHGGVFDRIDSLIAVLAVYAAWLAWFSVKVSV